MSGYGQIRLECGTCDYQEVLIADSGGGEQAATSLPALRPCAVPSRCDAAAQALEGQPVKIPLFVDWRDEEATSPDVNAVLAGTVVGAEYRPGRDTLVLHYADKADVEIHLHQCRTHSCDDTCMVIEHGEPDAPPN